MNILNYKHNINKNIFQFLSYKNIKYCKKTSISSLKKLLRYSKVVNKSS